MESTPTALLKASLDGFLWGDHNVEFMVNPARATIRDRFRCLLLDILTSPQLLATVHADEPYFSPGKLCWHTSISKTETPGLLQSLCQVHGLDEMIAEINIQISTHTTELAGNGTETMTIGHHVGIWLTAFDDQHKRIYVPDEMGGSSVPGPLGWELPQYIHMPQSLFPSINWATLGSILSQLTNSSYSMDGNSLNLADRRSKFGDIENPLNTLGYYGWPGLWPIREPRPKWTIFRTEHQ